MNSSHTYRQSSATCSHTRFQIKDRHSRTDTRTDREAVADSFLDAARMSAAGASLDAALVFIAGNHLSG